ncbi:hypothetical protein J6X09_02205 [Candidatus Saccharibacteria bacterium]|nr:hypothetical protein [Candidatus Saccharibacteria bacterium]
MSRKKWLLLLLVVGVFVSWLFCADVTKAADISLELKKEQATTGKDSHDQSLHMVDTVKPANVILDQWKVNFYKACQYHKGEAGSGGYELHFEGDTVGAFDCYYHQHGQTDNLPFGDEDFGNHYSIAEHYDGGKSRERHYDGTIRILSKGAATDVETREKYDVEFTLSNIYIKVDNCGNSGDTRTMITWSTGATDGTGRDHTGKSEFAGAHLMGHGRCDSGARYSVQVRLKSGKNYVYGKTMVWAVADIDIGDRFANSSAAKVYDPDKYPYAEHMTILGGKIQSEGAPANTMWVSTADHTELAVKNGNVLYHAMLDGDYSQWSGSGNVFNNSTSAIFRVSMDDFKFEWGGNQCGTTIINAPSTLYSGWTNLYYNGTDVGNDASVTIHQYNSGTIQFLHTIKREDDGQGGVENEHFKVRADMGTGSDDWVSGLASPMPFATNETKTAYRSNSVTAQLEPGQTKTYWQNLYYMYSNINNDLYANVGKYQIKINRPYAKYTGTTSATVTKNSGTAVSIPSNHVINLSESDNGHYEITFNNTITRKDDVGNTAGGTAITQYTTSYRVPATVPGASAVTWSSGAATSGEKNTRALTDGEAQSFSAKASGTLKYGETRTICYTMKYRARQTTNDGLTTASGSEYCVTIKRPEKKCDLDPNYAFGVVSGKNIAQLTVTNKNLSDQLKRTAIGVATSSVSIYARPSDNIRCSYNMCAGALYPIRENNIHSSHPVTFKASGWSSKNSTVNNNNKSLFRTEVSVVGSTYNNPRTWSSASPVGNFLKDSNPDNLIGSFTSPSSGAGTNYRCGTPESGWYQVAGKENCGRNNADYNVGVLDVGNTITQRLEWNEQSVTNGTTVGSASRTATANVVVPYNYILKPYITNSAAAGHVAYLGETVHMAPGVVVAKRKNSAVSNQTYATITKKTSVRVEYYYTDSTGVTIKKNPTTIYSKDNLRLNSESNLNGTGGNSDAYLENGGSSINPGDANANATNFNIPVNDSLLVPGDRVCMRIRVWPVDSHDNPNAGTVGAEAISLSESGAGEGSSRTTTSCLTVAKRPAISVESSNAYSATTIKTSQFNKELGDTKFRFGSWSEYGVYARVDTGSFIFASGAALGYNRSGYKNGSGEWLKSLNAVRDNPSGSDNVSTTNNSGVCTYMTQTFANANCQAGTKNVGGVAADQFSDRMISRYGRGNSNITNVPLKSMGGKDYQNLSGYSDGGVVDDNGAIIIRPNNDAYLGSNWAPNIPASVFEAKGLTTRNNTIVYSLPNKTLVIDGNINAQNGALSNVAQASGVVIVADKVLISSNVTYINATIVANEVNTCAFKADGSTISFNELKWTGASNYPCAKSLQFDSPVSTKRIVLNRTAGANNGTNSIVRAEVFNLNMAQLLWSYNQMARYNQAITTFSRELPPRY